MPGFMGPVPPMSSSKTLPPTGSPKPSARKMSRKSQPPKFGRSSKRSMSTRY